MYLYVYVLIFLGKDVLTLEEYISQETRDRVGRRRRYPTKWEGVLISCVKMEVGAWWVCCSGVEKFQLV